MKDFLFKDNKASMGDKLSLPFYENTFVLGAGDVRLFGRYQIQAKCDEDCRNFRYGAKVDALST